MSKINYDKEEKNNPLKKRISIGGIIMRIKGVRCLNENSNESGCFCKRRSGHYFGKHKNGNPPYTYW